MLELFELFGKILLGVVVFCAGWIILLPTKSFWTKIKRLNEAIKRVIFGAAYPLLTVTNQHARLTGNYTDNFVARTIVDHALMEQEAESSRIEREIREDNERVDHDIHPFITAEQRLPTEAHLRALMNYPTQFLNADAVRGLPPIQGSFTLRIEGPDRPRPRPSNLPAITQENCMHYFREFPMMNRPTLRVCEICGYEAEGLPKNKGFLPNCTHEWGPIQTYVVGNKDNVFGRVCHVCRRFRDEKTFKTVAELRRSKVRSLIMEIESDTNLPSV